MWDQEYRYHSWPPKRWEDINQTIDSATLGRLISQVPYGDTSDSGNPNPFSVSLDAEGRIVLTYQLVAWRFTPVGV